MSSSSGAGNGGRDNHKSPTVQHFDGCKLEPVIVADNSTIVACPDVDEEGLPAKQMYSTTSFYLDASGRSKMSLPLKFTFPSQEALDHFLANDCIHPVPENVVKDNQEEEGDGGGPFGGGGGDDGEQKTSLGFEVTTMMPPVVDQPMDMAQGEASMKSVYSNASQAHSHSNAPHLLHQQQQRAIVEGITVKSARIEGTSVFFDTQVIVRAAHHDSSVLIQTRLKVVAVLSEQPRDPPSQQSRMSYEGFPDFTLQTTLTASKVKHTRLEPFILNTILTDALAIDVTSVTGPTTGRTLVSLVMRHPNTHSEPVTITNIALHPGHSRLELPAPPGATQNHTSTHVVADMSTCVQWGYAPQTQPKLPMTLYPQGAFATILTIDAMEHMRSRSFKSPVSVTAVVGSPAAAAAVIAATAEEGGAGDGDGDAKKTTSDDSSPTTISSADAQWTTGRLAQEPSDAFRIDMQLQNKEFFVGEPFTIFLRVKNLSAEARDMMLLVAKDSDKQTSSGGTMTTTSSSSPATAMAQPTTNNLNIHHRSAGNSGHDNSREAMPFNQQQQQQQQQQQRSAVPNTAVVSEVNGYTFGVWGLIADADNPVFRLDRDQDLLAIDAALLLGEIKGHHSVEAQLRFNPLREGTLDVPNMQLFDKRNRKWYYCTHKLNIVARQKRTDGDKDDSGENNSENGSESS